MEIDALSLDLQNKSYDFNPFTKREREVQNTKMEITKTSTEIMAIRHYYYD